MKFLFAFSIISALLIGSTVAVRTALRSSLTMPVPFCNNLVTKNIVKYINQMVGDEDAVEVGYSIPFSDFSINLHSITNFRDLHLSNCHASHVGLTSWANPWSDCRKACGCMPTVEADMVFPSLKLNAEILYNGSSINTTLTVQMKLSLKADAWIQIKGAVKPKLKEFKGFCTRRLDNLEIVIKEAPGVDDLASLQDQINEEISNAEQFMLISFLQCTLLYASEYQCSDLVRLDGSERHSKDPTSDINCKDDADAISMRKSLSQTSCSLVQLFVDPFGVECLPKST